MPLMDDYQKEERIQGILYAMSPSAGFPHAIVNGNIYAGIYAQLKDSLCRVFMENADLYVDESNQEYVIPDIMLVCDTKAFRNKSSHYYGVPRFVVETLSPSTAHKDKTAKMDLYARKGIPEYWIVDYRSKLVDIYYLKEGRYELVRSYMLEGNREDKDYNGDEVIALREFPMITFLLKGIFDGLDDF